MSKKSRDYLEGYYDALKDSHRELRKKYGYLRHGLPTAEKPVLWDLDVMSDAAFKRLKKCHEKG